ncbi:MAG: glycosyltransferase family 2 protein [Pseudomonadota bacterium]
MPDDICSFDGPLIVVPCLNEARHIAAILHQFGAARDRLGGQLVVVDGGSTDGTCDLVAEYAARDRQVHLLHNPRRIQSAGINMAVAAFGEGASHLIRVDAHCAYADDYCDVLLDEARSTGADSVVVSMHAEGQDALQRAIAAAQNAPVGNGGSKHRNAAQGEFVDHGHHALIALSAFNAVGGYDPSFAHNEDAELDHRLTSTGHRIWLTGRTGVTYFPRSTWAGLARQYFNHGTGRARNILKHQTRPKVRQMKVIAVLPAVLAASLFPFAPLAALPALLWVSACLAMALPLALRGRDLSLLVAGPMAMVMHLSWSAGFWNTVLRTRPAMVGDPA